MKKKKNYCGGKKGNCFSPVKNKSFLHLCMEKIILL